MRREGGKEMMGGEGREAEGERWERREKKEMDGREGGRGRMENHFAGRSIWIP